MATHILSQMIPCNDTCLIIQKKPCPLRRPVLWDVFQLCTVLLLLLREKVRGLTVQRACFRPPLQSSPILSHFGLSLNSSPEAGGPQAASSSCFSCHSEVAEEVAVIDTAVPAVGLGGLPVTGAGGSVPSGCDWG